MTSGSIPLSSTVPTTGHSGYNSSVHSEQVISSHGIIKAFALTAHALSFLALPKQAHATNI